MSNQWSPYTMANAMGYQEQILEALGDVAQNAERIRRATGVSETHTDYNLRDLCSRGLARRFYHSNRADTFAITERGHAWRDQLKGER